MEQLRSTEALIELEDESPDVLFESTTGNSIHIWPLIRVALGMHSANNELASASARSSSGRADTVRNLWELATPNHYFSKHVQRNKDVLMVVGGGTTRQTQGGRENWLVDHFANAIPGRAAVVQDRAISTQPRQDEKPAFQGTVSMRDAALRVLIKSRMKPLPDESEKQIRKVIREILRHYQYPVNNALALRLEAAAIQQVRRAPHWQNEFERILNRTSPKIVLLDNASYMSKVAIIQTIRKQGLPIAEPQHGWIGHTQAAYNFGRAFSQPELKQYLPDVLLTFGDFWSERIRHPAEKFSVGKPYLEKASTAAEGTNQVRDQVLIASSIYRTEDLIRLSLSLRDALPPNMTLSIRPHPSERSRAESLYAAVLNEDRIRIDLEPDVYASFSRSSAVIGYASTVLFEALAFDIPAFVIDSPLANLCTPRSLFGDRIYPDGPHHELADQIVKYSAHHGARFATQETINSIWKPNAVENFKSFLASIEM